MTESTTPDRLLEAAIHAIEQHGEQALNVRTVAAECGVTNPIIYKAFGSREGLVVAAQAERFRRAIVDLAEPFGVAVRQCTTVDELRAVITRLMAATHDESRRSFRRVQFDVMGASVHRPELRAAVDAALRSLIDTASAALCVAQDRGLLRAGLDVAPMAWWFFGQVQSRFIVEQSDADIDGAAWNRLSTEAVLSLLGLLHE